MKLIKQLKKRPLLLMLSSLILMGACGRVRFELDRLAFVPVNVVTTIEEAKIKCDEAALAGTMLENVQTVTFSSTEECDWDGPDNLSKCNGIIRARREKYEDIDLPANATLCDMKFDFDVNPNMRYDDEILLTLGGKVLFSTQDYSILSGAEEYNDNGHSGRFSSGTELPDDGLMVDSLGLVTYKWLGDNGLRGMFYGYDVSSRYCLGVAPGDMDTDCIIPRTETTGIFNINIDKEHIIKIGQLNGLTFDDGEVISVPTPLEIGLIITGDNDRSDCKHETIEFDVKIKYVIQTP